MNTQTKHSATTLDRLAIGFSMVCAVHCVLMPVILLLLPALSATIFGSEMFHKLMLLVVLPTSLISLTLGYRKHGAWRPLVMGFCGLAILLLAALFGHSVIGETGEKIATVVGAALIAVSHFRNLHLCR